MVDPGGYGEIFQNSNLNLAFIVCTPSQCREDHIPDGSDMHHPHCRLIGNAYPLEC